MTWYIKDHFTSWSNSQTFICTDFTFFLNFQRSTKLEEAKPFRRTRKVTFAESDDVQVPKDEEQEEKDVKVEDETMEPVESCPVLAYREPLPTNVRLAKKYLYRGGDQPKIALRARHPSDGSSLRNPPESLIKSQDAFAERLYATYATLSSVPVPHLMRPVCQWLGLRLLARGDQLQAARYFAQAIGNAACGLFTCMLSSRIK